MNAQLFLFLFASVGVGCGLVHVNGKPITFGSSLSSDSGAQEQAEPEQNPKQTQIGRTEAHGQPGKTLNDIPDAPVKRLAWTPVQQYMQINKAERYWALIVGDELGAKLSHAGRLALAVKFRQPASNIDSTDHAISAALLGLDRADALSQLREHLGLGPELGRDREPQLHPVEHRAVGMGEVQRARCAQAAPGQQRTDTADASQ